MPGSRYFREPAKYILYNELINNMWRRTPATPPSRPWLVAGYGEKNACRAGSRLLKPSHTRHASARQRRFAS
jgi:hypothetical protein